MLLFFGFATDDAIRLALEAACELGVEHALLDQGRAEFMEAALRVDDAGLSGAIVVQSQTLPLDSIAGVYARPLSPEHERDARARARAQMLHDLMLEWLDVAAARVVSRPSAMHSNGSKPYQAQLIAAAGFEVPATLVSNDPASVREFEREHGPLIYKSTSGVRSIVRRLDAERARELARIRLLPTQFQAWVPGVDVRVHVVGAQLFATEIQSPAVDYRYAARDSHAVTLRATRVPADIERRCLALARRLELPFCGIDLRRRPDGRFVCFEVNPMPGYSYYQSHTGQPIARALVEYLHAGPD